MENTMERSLAKAAACAMVLLVAAAGTVRAQTQQMQDRSVGYAGAMQIGISGFADKFFTTQDAQPTIFAVQVDIGRFITDRWVVRGGLVGSGRFGGDHTDDVGEGPGVASVYGFGGLSFYFTPQSLMSAYVGADYSAQLTNRVSGDRGTVLGKLGLQMVLSDRLSFFVEGGYGFSLTPPASDSDGRQQRFSGQLGFRFMF
jgi:hypothetical protein